MSERVYETMHEAAENLIAAGRDVVLDASYMTRRHRNTVMELADRSGAECVFVLTRASDEIIRARLAKREASGRSLSDGRLEIYEAQAEAFEPLTDPDSSRLIVLDTDRPKAEVGAGLWSRLRL